MSASAFLRPLWLALALCLGACGSDDEGGGILDPDDPGGSSGKPVLTLDGPAVVAPGVATSGFTAKLATESGQAFEDVFVGLQVGTGQINAPPQQANSGGDNTDSFGRVSFAYQPPADITAATTVTILGAATVDDVDVEASLQVTVQPDTFVFLAPEPGTPVSVGTDNAEPVSFRWTRASGSGTQGVAGSLQLSVNNGARLVINNDSLNPTESAQVATSAGSLGNFTVPVSVYSNSSGFVTLTARDTSLTTRTATLSLQFVDAPGEINLSASPLVVTTSPSSSRFSTLELTVLNQASQPMTGVDVTFELVQSASGNVNERVFPSGGTTNAQGKATSRYEAGPTAGTALVRACVKNQSACDEREITVSAPSP